MNYLVSEKGKKRLINIDALPATDIYADIRYEGSISKCGDNADWDWGLYQDENGEWVLMECDGPGCIYNFTQHRYPTSPVPEFRFYFDGADSPQFCIKPEEFGSKYPFVSPLADLYCGPEDGGRGPIWVVRSFVPMEFQKGCKVTSTIKLEGCDKSLGQGGWGHILYHTYATDDGLTTFQPSEEINPLLSIVKEEYKNSVLEDSMETRSDFNIKSGVTVSVFQKIGQGVIKAVRLKIKDFTPPMLSQLFIRLTWDGEDTPSVFAPIGTFFGNEYGETEAELRTFLLEMKICPGKNAEFGNFFPMPFWESAKIELINRCDFDINVESIEIYHLEKNCYSKRNCGYFTSSPYYSKRENKEGKNSVIAEIQGTGHMVYGTLSGYDIACGCEGDVRVFLDDSKTPSVESDGSESWASYGWGFVTPPQCNPFSAYHGKYGENDTWSQVRLTVGDAYSFRKSLCFELEHGCQNDGGGFHSGQIFYYLLSNSHTSITITDTLLIGETESCKKHGYVCDGKEITISSGYENGIHSDLFEASGMESFTASSFTAEIDPKNSGVILKRFSDQQKGRQKAQVSVDGEIVSERSWYAPDNNPFYRFLDDTFLIPPRYTKGKSTIQITIKPESESWNEYQYTVFSLLEEPQVQLEEMKQHDTEKVPGRD